MYQIYLDKHPEVTPKWVSNYPLDLMVRFYARKRIPDTRIRTWDPVYLGC